MSQDLHVREVTRHETRALPKLLTASLSINKLVSSVWVGQRAGSWAVVAQLQLSALAINATSGGLSLVQVTDIRTMAVKSGELQKALESAGFTMDKKA